MAAGQSVEFFCYSGQAEDAWAALSSRLAGEIAGDTCGLDHPAGLVVKGDHDARSYVGVHAGQAGAGVWTVQRVLAVDK